ncbi:AAA domain-containing protein [Kineothrix alysoides]|uniref:AAA domain-containing protein n=1 Tax=Kineothrix alysoides TaxID=1469948 RepID=A0A4R1QUB0_9FIRM|nr:kinase [Kineothrix alysoides]TCL56671.1 AAA domain-containing protein [Kineothrix alysoides]
MSSLIIIRGNSGSGKTTIAKGLQQKFGHNTMLISQDVVRRDILKVKDGFDTKALPLMMELLIYGKSNCDIVILEGIMYADWYKPLFELATAQFDNIFAYYYDLSFEETLKRHQTKSSSNEFGADAMRQWWRDKDFIGIIPEAILTRELEAEDTIDFVYKDVIKEEG